MAVVVVDTDILIDHLRGVEAAVRQVTSLAETGRLRTTTITLFELLSGADAGHSGDAVRKLAEDLEALPLDRKSSIRAAEVRKALEGAGQTIGMADSLIAGNCLANDVALLSRNRKHFSRVADLKLIDFDGQL